MSHPPSVRNTSFVPSLLIALALGGSGCARGEAPRAATDTASRVGVDSSAPVAATTAPSPNADTSAPTVPAVVLPPLADTIAQRLVFAPVIQNWFAAAARGKRLLVDLGRIDIDLKKDEARKAAFVSAAEARSPISKGTRFRLRGPWGADDATVSGFDVYNGRIVATVDVDPRIDSLASTTDPLVATAERVSATAQPAATTCDRTLDAELRGRLTQLGDSVERSLRAGEQPIYPRLQKSVRAKRSFVAGCFGAAKAIVIVTLWAGDYEWVKERVLLVSDGGVKPLPVRDLRFRAHEALEAFDADEDGVDDLAARAWTPRGGGTVVLRLVEGARLERLASGFAWER